ncbi:hypothetical protein BDW59DRAFT_148324 [Aspergillus cavernicola]|uniref:Rhodopsin domain-containing protein n=1 Tax=Aspergillus cavernicola TaxID=176166 RepID=A0ABR4I7P7_9EURO
MPFPTQKEAWTEYGIGVLVIMLRIFARFKVVGVKNWQGDDYFCILVLAFWTAELCMLELIGQYGTNIGLTDDQRAALTPDQTDRLVYGSKCLMAGWTCYVCLIWSLKACMLFFYNRLTLGLMQQKLVKFNAVLCASTFVAVIMTIFLHCRPISKHFQVYPDPGLNCSADYVNYIVIASTNVVTDAILLSIPIPLLAKVRLALRRKLIIGVLLCGGIFVIAATLLRCILSLQSIDNINNSTIWAIRETFVAIIAINAPCIKPLFSSSVWLRSSSKDPSSGREGYGNGKSSNGASFRMSGFGKSKAQSQLDSTVVSRPGRDSDEFILRETRQDHPEIGFAGGERDGSGSGSRSSIEDEEGGRKGGIQVTTVYEVRREGN